MAFGGRLADAGLVAGWVHLTGDLGAGKTTLVRGFLRRAGVDGAIRSPTYTLVEQYATGFGPVYHLDLYRLSDPEELEFLGLRDLCAANALYFVEWPERGLGFLPAADLVIEIRHLDGERQLILSADSPLPGW
jgi:tRNA threonylcarbamoyladenosine biosynthesis protein TsaE